MDEDILRSIFGLDEAEALRVVEPLHCTNGTHTVLPLLVTPGPVYPYRSITRE
jgi:hypothetical protein